ncbi:MAG: EVE domain-containing protein [Myxococcales bacterium]|nr:EVE domain-containing protein [Myxococcales bacterium]
MDVSKTGEPDATVNDIRDSFVRMFGDAHVKTCAAFVADAIERAATHGAARWVASLRGPARINITVGRAYVLSLQKDVIYVPVDRASIDAATSQALAALTTSTDDQFKSIPGTITYAVPAEKLAAARELLVVGHHAFIDRAAQTAKQTPYYYAHCKAIVDFLNSTLDRNLAQPAYEEIPAPAPTARAWLFQANPQQYDLPAALAELDELNWGVRQQSKKIRAGDTAYLWLSGEGGGLLARALVTTDPDVLPPRASEAKFRRSDEPAEDERAVVVRIEQRLAEPVDRDQLLSYVELEDLGFLQAAQGTNFALSPRHAAVLRELSEGRRPSRLVKVAPGELAKYWDDCRLGGYICVGWDDVGDLSKFASFGESRKAFAETWPTGTSPGHITLKAKELWTLRSLRPGDQVVANRGVSEVLAVGKVTGPYVFRPDRPEYRHTVSVSWDISLARTLPEPQPLWGLRTVTAIAPELAAIIFGKAPPPSAAPPLGAYDAIQASLQKDRLFFSDETVSHYLLALQTKRFVILTGISGTGKTMLARGVARHFRPRLTTRQTSEPPDDAVTIRVAPYMLKYRRFVMPVALRDELFRDGKISEVELRAGGQVWTCHVSQTHEDRVATVQFRKELTQWFKATFQVGDELVLRPSLDGKPHIDLVQAQYTETTTELENYAVIAVRPDWTDGRNLLGFYNPISRRYETTPFLRLLLRAQDEVARAQAEQRAPHRFFVILDEMNLARVEHYFSTSCPRWSRTSRSSYTTRTRSKPVRTATTRSWWRSRKKVHVPPNLFFTGTVNVDETTHMFSPKVLDRAFVMELHDVDLNAHGAASPSDDELRLDGFTALVDWGEAEHRGLE